MNVVGHQALGRAAQVFAHSGVQHHLTEADVEKFVEPAGAALGDWHCPMNDGVALIMFAA
jgi:hypothetical protein